MNITCIGLDYNSADVALRGKVAFTESRYEKAYSHFKASKSIEGCVILSTCNRTEIYINSSIQGAETSVKEFLKSFFGIDEREIKHFFSLTGRDAMLHLFRVASGLESMVIGEDQILSQVKEAQNKSNTYDAADTVLNKVFRDAITCAKEIKHCTAMSQNKLSVASLAVEAVLEQLGTLENAKAMVVGVGEMSRLTIKNLFDKGIKDIILVNRTKHNARELLNQHPELRLVDYNQRYEHLGDISILVSSTAAPHLVFEYDRVKESCNGGKVVMVDLAVPRDIEAAVAQMENVTLIDMDYLQKLSQRNAELRKELSAEAEQIIEDYMNKLHVWMNEADLHQLLSKIDNYVEHNVANQAEALIYKEGYEDCMYSQELKTYGLSLTNKMLKKMALKIKSLPQEKGRMYIHVLEELLE